MIRALMIFLCVSFAVGVVWMVNRSGSLSEPGGEMIFHDPTETPTETPTVLAGTSVPTAAFSSSSTPLSVSVPPLKTPTAKPVIVTTAAGRVPTTVFTTSRVTAVPPRKTTTAKPVIVTMVSSPTKTPTRAMSRAAAIPGEESGPVQYVIEDVTGQVLVQTSAGASRAVTEGSLLSVGETLSVSSGGSAVLALNEQTNAQVGPDSKVTLVKLEESPQGGFTSLLKLLRGSILSQVEKLQVNHSNYEVESGGILCGVRGTVFEVENDGLEVQTLAHEGVVGVASSSFAEERVAAGKAFRFAKGRVLARRALTEKDRGRFKGWNARRQGMIQKRRLRLEKFRRARLERVGGEGPKALLNAPASSAGVKAPGRPVAGKPLVRPGIAVPTKAVPRGRGVAPRKIQVLQKVGQGKTAAPPLRPGSPAKAAPPSKGAIKVRVPRAPATPTPLPR